MGASTDPGAMAGEINDLNQRIRQLEDLNRVLAAEVDAQRPVVEAARVLACSLRRWEPEGWSGAEEALERAVAAYESSKPE